MRFLDQSIEFTPLPGAVSAFTAHVSTGQLLAFSRAVHAAGRRLVSLWGSDERDRDAAQGLALHVAFDLTEGLVCLTLPLSADKPVFPDLAQGNHRGAVEFDHLVVVDVGLVVAPGADQDVSDRGGRGGGSLQSRLERAGRGSAMVEALVNGWQPDAPFVLDALRDAEVRALELLYDSSNYVFLAALMHPEHGEGLAVYKPVSGEAP